MTLTNTFLPTKQEIFNHFIEHQKSVFSRFSFTYSMGSGYEGNQDGFRVTAEKRELAIHAEISTNTNSGFRYALNAVLEWIIKAESSALILEDSPDFPIRGVIEGFYGKPWTQPQRLRMLDYFGDFGMNSYFIAPKDAPWQRFNWRAPFQFEFLDLTRELVERGNLNGVSVSVCVSPGLSVVYSDQQDVDAVIVRFKQLLELGVSHFGLLWDDISWEFQNPKDSEKYPSIAIAHADFSNRVFSELRNIHGSAELTVCPMNYHGRGVVKYIEEIGATLDPEIKLMWTGRQICSEYLDIADAIVFEKSAKRRPFYWDNFPVNDGGMQTNLYIGPLRGREKGLHNYSAGLLSNPMLQGEASLIPLSTIGDYLWNTDKYDPETSWERAIARIIPAKLDRESIRHFFLTTMGSTVGGDPAPELRKIFNSAVSQWRNGFPKKAAEEFRNAGNEIISNYNMLTSGQFTNKILLAEISDWLEKYKLGGETLIGVASVLDICFFDHEKKMIQGPVDAPAKIHELLETFRAHKKRLFGDQIDGPFNELIAELMG